MKPSPSLGQVLLVASLSIALVGCFERNMGPCTWDGRQDREAGAVQATSLECDGVSTMPAPIHARYAATSSPLSFTIDANSAGRGFIAQLYFEPALPDGTYSIEGSSEPTLPDPNAVDSSGAIVTGTFTFSRSRDVPFADIAEPEARVYTSTIDASFDLVAVLPHPDPAMGPGCRLETGPQRVMLSVTGPVRECTANGPTTGH